MHTPSRNAAIGAAASMIMFTYRSMHICIILLGLINKPLIHRSFEIKLEVDIVMLEYFGFW